MYSYFQVFYYGLATAFGADIFITWKEPKDGDNVSLNSHTDLFGSRKSTSEAIQPKSYGSIEN